MECWVYKNVHLHVNNNHRHVIDKPIFDASVKVLHSVYINRILNFHIPIKQI